MPAPHAPDAAQLQQQLRRAEFPRYLSPSWRVRRRQALRARGLRVLFGGRRLTVASREQKTPGSRPLGRACSPLAKRSRDWGRKAPETCQGDHGQESHFRLGDYCVKVVHIQTSEPVSFLLLL